MACRREEACPLAHRIFDTPSLTALLFERPRHIQPRLDQRAHIAPNHPAYERGEGNGENKQDHANQLALEPAARATPPPERSRRASSAGAAMSLIRPPAGAIREPRSSGRNG